MKLRNLSKPTVNTVSRKSGVDWFSLGREFSRPGGLSLCCENESALSVCCRDSSAIFIVVVFLWRTNMDKMRGYVRFSATKNFSWKIWTFYFYYCYYYFLFFVYSWLKNFREGLIEKGDRPKVIEENFYFIWIETV